MQCSAPRSTVVEEKHFMRCAVLVCFVVSVGCAAAQSHAADPARFTLEANGRQIGSAEYQVTPASDSFHLQASYSFDTNGVPVKATRDASFDASYGLQTDRLAIHASATDEDVSVIVDADRKKFQYKLKSSVQDIEQTMDLHPGTVILNNFDPSGVQQLVWLAAKHPVPSGEYWALLAQGKGVYIPIKLTSAEAREGTLNGEKLTLKHWKLEISDVDTEIWADQQNQLMQFSVSAQDVSYRREGFQRTLSEAEKTPGSDAAEERTVSFMSDGLKFPAILTLPKNRQHIVPIVVMVQGSGPRDADETIGPNKPFRDIAYGLAAQGVASLRYDKRTHFAPETFQAHPDLDHEVTLDAIAALRYAVTVPEADPRRVFLLGHSLGGTMAPVIAADFLKEKPNSLRGIIFMAAGVVSVDQTIERQTTFQAKQQGATDAQQDEIKKQWQQVFATVKDTNTPADRAIGVAPLEAPTGYWRSWLLQDPAGELAKLDLPALVLRGFDDIQVSEQDFKLLEEANTAPGSVGEQFDGLNHLFMSAAGDSSQPAHVSPDVITTIASWIATIR
jgi:dienelactone hydrolase